MRTTLFILRYRLLGFRRWIGSHGFEIFVLGPVIAGGVLWVLDRQLTHLRAPLGSVLAGGAPGGPGAASLVLALMLVAVALPATARELYDHRGPSGALDALPVAAAARFHASLAVELARTVPAFAVLTLAVAALVADPWPPAGVLAAGVTRLLAACLTLALARFAVTLLVVHYQLFGGVRWLALGAVALLSLGARHPAPRLLLLPCLAPAAQIEAVLLRALGGPRAPASAWAEGWALAATALGLYLLARFLYRRWHRRDLEVAARVAAARRPSAPGLLGLLPRFVTVRAGRPLVAQIARDVVLVLRRFSSAVPLAFALALVLDGVVLTLLLDAGLPRLWRERLAVSGLTLSVLAIVALVPFLLKHQLPRFWIEKSTGVELERIWVAKLWTAALLALSPFAAGVAILAAAPGLAPAGRTVAVLQFAAAAWIVTSILALAVFEIAAQPLLGLLFGSLLGLALAALFVFYPQAWWLWTVGYLWVANQIAGRATRRVRLVEAGG